MRAPGVPFFDRVLRAPKRHTAGTHRSRSPAATLASARRLMRPLEITRLANLTGLDSLGVPVYSAIRPNGRSLSTSQGKGFDATAAAASALMESIETWHAEHLAMPHVRGSWRGLGKRLPLCDPRLLPRAGRGRLDLAARWDWVEGWDLFSARPIWVPAQAVTLDCVLSRPPVFDVSSNGLASGNHLLEAIVHGLCEVIERDAEARWRAERDDRQVDLATIVDPPCRELIARCRAAGVHVTVWDLTSDVGVPVYGAALMEDPTRSSWRALGLYQGFGCHLSAEIALGRELCEAAQTRVTYIAGSRDDFFPFDYARATDPTLLRQIWREVTRPARRPADFRRAPRLARASFEDDVFVLLEQLSAAGSTAALVVDLTRAEYGIPVAKTLIPGRATHVELMG